MENIEQQKVISMSKIFDSRFIDSNTLYLHHFNEVPSLHFRNKIDGEKAFEAISEKYGQRIVNTYQYRWFHHQKKKFQFDTTIVILDNHCLLEFDKNYCQVLHNNEQAKFLEEVDNMVSQFKEKQKRKPREMNLIIRTSGGFELKTMEIKKTKLDLDLFYEDNFGETDQLIRKRLAQKKDRGIVLLHGLPGTGKTTYLRHLIGRIRKKILFISPAVASGLLNPDFVDLLIENPDSVLIIEDAENIIMDRKLDPGSAVSDLLNISDGLLADCLNVQLICTFNSPLTMIDSALLRKGRLIAKYEFGKLSVEKSQRLSDHLGFKTKISHPMTIADIAGQHEKTQRHPTIEVIGFRRHNMEN
jgi:tRNA uridine 5-carbamoylmethylation protein Kti12